MVGRRVQLWDFEVSAAELERAGASIEALIGHRSLTEPVPDETPGDGWRQLTVASQIGMLLAAPAGEGRWTLLVLSERDGRLRPRVVESVQVHPSRAERRAGLELRWPAAAHGRRVDEIFVDVLNTANQRWAPTELDQFHITAKLLAPDTENSAGHFYAGWSGADPAFPLDPGEYARVAVHVQQDVRGWKPGTYWAAAFLPALGLATVTSLPVEVTADYIARYESRHRPPPLPPSTTERSERPPSR